MGKYYKHNHPVDEVKSDDAPELKFGYQCPACTNIAINTSNKMLGVEVDCQSCGKHIKLDDPERYREAAQ